MKVKEFNQDYEIDRKARGVKANAKTAPAPIMPETADKQPFDLTTTYFFFDVSTQAVRQSTGLKFEGLHLWAFGLRVIEVSRLRANRDDALADAQKHCNEQIESLREKVRKFEAKKQNRGLKAVLTSR